jgi:hypothetical protein
MARDGRRWLGATAIVLAGGALVAASLLAAAARTSGRDAVLALARGEGLLARAPDVVRHILYADDADRAALSVARRMVAEVLDPSLFSHLPAREAMLAAAGAGARLDTAVTMAGGVMARRPASWEAAMLLGAARYLRLSQTGDRRLFSEQRLWEEPLRAAGRLAPGEEEPQRTLTLAYLEAWPALDTVRRAEAKEVLRHGFHDAATFRRGAEAWLAVAGSRDAAFALVPERTEQWDTLLGIFAGRGDWEDFLAARRGYGRAADLELAAGLEELEARRRGGDLAGARGLALQLIGATPRERGYAARMEKVLGLLPPGPSGRGAAFHEWLERAETGFVLDRPLLDAATVGRLRAGSSALPPAEDALAALAAGELAEAEAIERRAGGTNLEVWGPYCVAKARVLTRRGEFDGARRILLVADRWWARSPVGLEVAVGLAAASGDAPAAEDARERLAAATADGWPATDWVWREGVPELMLRTGETAEGFEVAVDRAPAGGAVVQVLLDLGVVAEAAARAGGTVEVGTPVEAGTHLLEVRVLRGGRVYPGAVQVVR